MQIPPDPGYARRGAIVSLLLLLGMVGLLVVPSVASAHASLVGSSPARDALVETAPDEVTLVFTGTVVASPGSIQIFGPDETRIETGPPRPARSTRVTQRVDPAGDGTYGVAYRVASEDGHVITGAFTFDVGAERGDGAAGDASRVAAEVPRGLQAAFSITRFVEITALLVAAGSGLFACVIAPGWRPRFLVAMLVLLLVSFAVGLVLNTAMIRGDGISDAIGSDSLRATLETPFGLSLAIRAVVALVALGPALLLRHGPPLHAVARWACALVFVGLASSLSITGHAATSEPVWLRMPLDMVHVTAAAIWIGGLVQLAWLAPFAASWIDALVRFSRTAAASVAVLLLTGAYATFVELDAQPGQLLDSTYGRLIVAKLLLYLGAMPLAWNNMRTFVPNVRRRPDDAPVMLRQYVRRELLLVLVVVALTVWLIATPQPR